MGHTKPAVPATVVIKVCAEVGPVSDYTADTAFVWRSGGQIILDQSQTDFGRERTADEVGKIIVGA